MDFRGKYNFLSNFYKSPILVQGIKYPTVEHAFQAMKTYNLEERIMISFLESPAMAKRKGRHVELRDDWEDSKIYLMFMCLAEKFKDKSLAEKLLKTGNIHLEETNKWGDTFWGVCNGKGSNHLGKLLMEIRDRINTKLTLDKFNITINGEN